MLILSTHSTVDIGIEFVSIVDNLLQANLTYVHAGGKTIHRFMTKMSAKEMIHRVLNNHLHYFQEVYMIPLSFDTSHVTMDAGCLEM